jgi:uncharacterized protein (TIGR02246 family)
LGQEKGECSGKVGLSPYIDRRFSGYRQESFDMTDDERAIRELVETWFEASRSGDLQTVLDLMTDDAVFLVPGAEPFGKEAFAAAFKGMNNVRIEGKSDIQEIKVLGDWAYFRSRIDMTAMPPGGTPARRSGYTLTIMRKEPDGRWRLARDANLLTAKGA